MRRISLLLALVLSVGLLAGCSGAGQESSSSAGPSASAVEEAEQEQVTVRVAVPALLEGPLAELGDAYASDKPWLSFEQKAFPDSTGLNAALLPEGTSSSSSTLVTIGSAGSSSSASSSGADSESSSNGKTESLYDLVLEDSLAAMNAAEAGGAFDLSTRSDMLSDSVVLVVSDGSDINAVSTASLQAGAFHLALAPADTENGVLQREVLTSLGLYADGAFTGAFAPVELEGPSVAASTGASSEPVLEKVVEADSTAGFFEALDDDPSLVGIVRTTDLYRYGGVKVVGEVPGDMHAPLCYPMALSSGLDQLEDGGHVREVASDFLCWMVTDEDALRILEKWGLSLLA